MTDNSIEQALLQAEHELATLHGLTASDGTREYYEALEDGCDAAGAWDCYLESTWKLDTTMVLQSIKAALALIAERKEEVGD